MIEANGDTIREAAWEMIQKIQNGEDPRDIIEKQEKDEDGTVNISREQTGDGLWRLNFKKGDEVGTVDIKHRVALDAMRALTDPLTFLERTIERMCQD